jgi:hypothetical protein
MIHRNTLLLFVHFDVAVLSKPEVASLGRLGAQPRSIIVENFQLCRILADLRQYKDQSIIFTLSAPLCSFLLHKYHIRIALSLTCCLF